VQVACPKKAISVIKKRSGQHEQKSKTVVHLSEDSRLITYKGRARKEILLNKNWSFPGEEPVVKQDDKPKK
jgi:hypothetical protein